MVRAAGAAGLPELMNRGLARAGLRALCAALCACGGAASSGGDAGAAPTWQEAAHATYAGIEESPVTLSNGSWEGEPFAPGGASRPQVALVQGFWMSGDLDGDSAPEAVVLLGESSGGSGSDLYLAALAHRGDAVLATGTALVGNRVQVRNARIEGGRTELDVVQAGPTDAMCCPGEKATRVFAFEGEALVEVESRVTGRLVPGDLSGVEWLLTDLAWNEAAPAEPPVTLMVEGSRASGHAGCNRYFGEIRAGDSPGELAIGPIGSTRMACAEPAMALEARYLAALGHATKFSFVAGRLALTSQQGERSETLLFRARPLSPSATQ